jgi:phosphoketolase
MEHSHKAYKYQQITEMAHLCRKSSDAFSQWAAGYGVVRHTDLTQVRIHRLAELLKARGIVQDIQEVFHILTAADKICCGAMWLVVHLTYAREVYLDGRDLAAGDFKVKPEGHTGGSLNMVPAYVGYLAANAITGITRSWLMGQGHCVAAIDSTNLIVGNMTKAHEERYDLSDLGLTRFVKDFYSYKITPEGRPEAPLGSHVNAHTAGGLIEGGYLGFAELLYAHMPLPGERLVVFLSDGAFEEQRGGDWAPRWWRSEDCGLLAPIMIANGRRIDQRTTLSQQGGVSRFREHLLLNDFDPIDIDGRDPAAFAWAILEMEDRLTAYSKAVAEGAANYPVLLPYTIAEAPKGFGFPGAGTNFAHNLPLGANPATDADARSRFNNGARQIWVPLPELTGSVSLFNNHEKFHRPQEKDHPLALRSVQPPHLPEADWREEKQGPASPMRAIDATFCAIAEANPHLRPRIGNPDELRSNRMDKTLETYKHRVTSPEEGIPEALDGKIITALNEETVVCAALANKGGINIVVTYEAFAPKMLGAVRQELIFTRNQLEAGYTPRWLSVPLVLSSHTWENGKNEHSHQDPTMCEALMNEMTDMSRVVFPVDWNSAMAMLRVAYSTTARIWTMVVPKRELPIMLAPEQAEALVRDGAVLLHADDNPQVILAAVGAYQLQEAMKISLRLREKRIAHYLVCIGEPARFRYPRDEREKATCVSPNTRQSLFPDSAASRVFLTHTRPEPLLGVIRPLDTGRDTTRVLGYNNHGGTLNVAGMLAANHCTWAHALTVVADMLSLDPKRLLTSTEQDAVTGRTEPLAVLY